MNTRSIVILGSTGSIGTQTLEICRRFSRELRVEGLSAGTNADLLLRQVAQFQPKWVHLADESAASRVRSELNGWDGEFLSGNDALVRMAVEPKANMVVVATVGWTGVEPTLAAINAGRDVALANKEVLVCAGDLVMKAAAARGVRIWPLDSEHNAIMQCLAAGHGHPSPHGAPVRRIVLTASGGPFRNAAREDIDNATVAQTLAHPTWNMGRKITVDSATLMNKGFEVIEAVHLFGIPLEKIQVVVHPQSIIHSIVEFVDGSMIAQMGVTDMRLPIQNVLMQPWRRPTTLEPLDLIKLARLDFAAPDLDRFPCLAMSYESAQLGGTAPCVLNAANEVAVAAHLDGRITCGTIPRIIRKVLDQHNLTHNPDLETLRHADRWARAEAEKGLAGL